MCTVHLQIITPGYCVNRTSMIPFENSHFCPPTSDLQNKQIIPGLLTGRSSSYESRQIADVPDKEIIHCLFACTSDKGPSNIRCTR